MFKRDNHDINLGRILTQKADKPSAKLDNSVLPGVNTQPLNTRIYI